MTGLLDISQVAKLTELSARALRFYEARGLVKPLRTASGRRCYSAVELERLHRLLALKRAGLSLSQIGALFDRPGMDLRDLISRQLELIEAQARRLAENRLLLSSTLSRIDRGEPIDAETFCSLIRYGDKMMTEDAKRWQALTDRYMTTDARADFLASHDKMEVCFDDSAYRAQWQDLGARIKAALPLDPSSDSALVFVREWFALLAPFSAVATPAMWEGAKAMYGDMKTWEGDADPGFDSEVFDFISLATTTAISAGHDVGPLPAFVGAK